MNPLTGPYFTFFHKIYSRHKLWEVKAMLIIFTICAVLGFLLFRNI